MPARHPRRSQRLDHAREGHAATLKRRKHRVPLPQQVIAEARVSVHRCAQHHRIHETTHHVPELRRIPQRHRRADEHIGLTGQPDQQAPEDREQHHEWRGTRGAGQRTQPVSLGGSETEDLAAG